MDSFEETILSFFERSRDFGNFAVLYRNIPSKRFLKVEADNGGNNILYFAKEVIYEVSFDYYGNKIFEGGYRDGSPEGQHKRWVNGKIRDTRIFSKGLLPRPFIQFF